MSAAREQDVVAAAVERLGRDLGRPIRLQDERPDEVNRTTRAIDFLAGSGEDLIGVEHTRIEPFDNHLRLQAQMTTILGPLCDELDGALPAGAQFELHLSAKTPPQLRRGLVEALRMWVMTTAPRLGTPPDHYADSPAELPIPARLYRWETPATELGHRPQLQLRIAVGVDNTLETLRSSRLDRALGDKLPKLEEARATHAVNETLLVLESDDSQATNAWLVASAIRGAAVRWPLPDHVVFVDVSFGHRLVWLLRRSGQWLPDHEISMTDERYAG